MKIPKTIYLLLIMAVSLFCACDKDNPASSSSENDPTSTDREKFIGNWAGSYGCPTIGVLATPDTLIITNGTGDLGFSITIHSHSFNPDTVNGELTDKNFITIPEQNMGGFPGTAEITFSNNMLEYSQTGFGITCGGADYVKY